MRKSDINNSEEIVKSAGEYLYAKYYGSVITSASKFWRNRMVDNGDIVNEWFARMLDLIKRKWDSSQESLDSFVARRWYFTLVKAWRFVHHRRDYGKGEPISVLCHSLEGASESVGMDLTPCTPKEYFDFEEYEEFELILERVRPSSARLLRDRLYEGLSAKEMARRYNLTKHSVESLLQVGREKYREIYKGRHNNETNQCVHVRGASEDRQEKCLS